VSVDNTNVLIKERARYIAMAQAAGFQIVGYYFRVDVQAALERNNQRTGKAAVPAKALLGTYKRLQRPRLEEGFDRLYYVFLDQTNQFQVQEWMDEV
jgi:predicted kinase